MKQKASVTFEQQETVVLKQSGSHRQEFCPRCDEESMFVTPEILAALTGSNEREIFRLIEAGEVYFVEEARILGCSGCYTRAVGDGATRFALPEPDEG